MLPLHLATLSSTSVEVITALAAAFPQGLGLKDDLSRTPLDCAHAAAAQGAGTPNIVSEAGYTHREYAGLNDATRERLAHRCCQEHLQAIVMTLEALGLRQSRVKETATEPETWRHSYELGMELEVSAAAGSLAKSDDK